MNLTTQKPERNEAIAAIKQAVITGAYDWPAGEEFTHLARQLAAHLHTTISTNEFESIVDAYNDYTGMRDWNKEEIMRYLDATRWHPAHEDSAWDKALRVLTETTNAVLLALHYDLLDDEDTARLYSDQANELRSAA